MEAWNIWTSTHFLDDTLFFEYINVLLSLLNLVHTGADIVRHHFHSSL